MCHRTLLAEEPILPGPEPLSHKCCGGPKQQRGVLSWLYTKRVVRNHCKVVSSGQGGKTKPLCTHEDRVAPETEGLPFGFQKKPQRKPPQDPPGRLSLCAFRGLVAQTVFHVKHCLWPVWWPKRESLFAFVCLRGKISVSGRRQAGSTTARRRCRGVDLRQGGWVRAILSGPGRQQRRVSSEL